MDRGREHGWYAVKLMLKSCRSAPFVRAQLPSNRCDCVTGHCVLPSVGAAPSLTCQCVSTNIRETSPQIARGISPWCSCLMQGHWRRKFYKVAGAWGNLDSDFITAGAAAIRATWTGLHAKCPGGPVSGGVPAADRLRPPPPIRAGRLAAGTPRCQTWQLGPPTPGSLSKRHGCRSDGRARRSTRGDSL